MYTLGRGHFAASIVLVVLVGRITLLVICALMLLKMKEVLATNHQLLNNSAAKNAIKLLVVLNFSIHIKCHIMAITANEVTMNVTFVAKYL